MKTVIFQGYLNKLYPEGIKLEATSAYEALTLLENYPGFREEDNVRHRVTLPKFFSRDSFYLPTDDEVIEVVPLTENEIATVDSFEGGGGGGGFLQVVIGTIIATIGFVTGQAWAVKLGIGIALGGLLQMLMPQPEAMKGGTDERSNYLPANRNTQRIGTPIPILVGRRKVYGHYLAYNITASNMKEPTAEPTPENTHAGGANSEGDIVYDNDWNTADGL